MCINAMYDGVPNIKEAYERHTNPSKNRRRKGHTPKWRERTGRPKDWVSEEVVRLIALESDIGEAFVEEIPSASNSVRTIRVGDK